MIEDKSLDLKIAVNKDEAFWTKTKDKCLEAIESCKREIIINEHFLILVDQKIKESVK